MNRTKIEWTDYSWNPITGCSRDRCAVGDDCYAYKMAQRLRGRYGYPKNNPFRVTFHPNRLNDPLKVKKPSKIFTCSMGEMFDKESKYGWLAFIFGVMERCPKHVFQVLTKQPDSIIPVLPENLWFGVSVTGQGDEWRINELKKIEANIRFISFEPLLSSIDFDKYPLSEIQWVIIGKLTGSKRVKLDDEWVTDIVMEAYNYNIPVFLKNNLGYPNPVQEFPT